jgi:hypothetical protein
MSNLSAILARASTVFGADVSADPPLTLRGGNEVDGYRSAEPFDASQDEPTDTYLEQFAYWGLIYLDAQSWRHYLPRLMAYAFNHPDDPRMVTGALVRSLRPPDRYPPRLATLTPDQENVVRSFLELVALGGSMPHLQEEAQQALEEWWLPNPRCRPTAEESAALRAAPVSYRRVGGDVYRLTVPDSLIGSGVRDIPEESRRVATWGGYMCGDAHTVVAVNVTPLAVRSLADSVRARATLYRDTPLARPIIVSGSHEAVRLDGLTRGDSPAEPQALTIVIAVAERELVTLSIRWWGRDDVRREIERIVDAFEIVPASASETH